MLRSRMHPVIRLADLVESIRLVVVEQLVPTLSEALSNVARHAEATEATEVTVTLDLTDDGRGMADGHPPGNGFDNIEARAERLRGTSQLRSSERGGGPL